MKAIITTILLMLSVSLVSGAEPDIQTVWSQSGLTPEERTELVEMGKKEPFHTIIPSLLKLRVAYQPSYHINPWGSTSWNNDNLEPQDRAYLMALAVWQHHILPKDEPAKAFILLSLLQNSSVELEKLVIIGTMMNSQWFSQAEEVLLGIAEDEKEDLDVRRAAVSALLSRCKVNTYMPLALEIILTYEKGLPRCRAFNLTTDKGHRLFSLSLQNKRLVVAAGFEILNELPKKDLKTGYFAARRLGYLLRFKKEFTPNRIMSKLLGKNELTDEFRIETVNNAIRWYAENGKEFKSEKKPEERGLKSLLRRLR